MDSVSGWCTLAPGLRPTRIIEPAEIFTVSCSARFARLAVEKTRHIDAAHVLRRQVVGCFRDAVTGRTWIRFPPPALEATHKDLLSRLGGRCAARRNIASGALRRRLGALPRRPELAPPLHMP